MNKKLLICLISFAFCKIQSAQRSPYNLREIYTDALYNHIFLKIDRDPKYAKYLEDSINAFDGFESLPIDQEEQAQRLGITLKQYEKLIDETLCEKITLKKNTWRKDD